MKRTSFVVAAGLGLMLMTTGERSAEASWQTNPPGLTEIISCINQSGAFNPIHWTNNWLTPSFAANPQFTYFDSRTLPGPPYWNYATMGDNNICHNWVNGSVAGGATLSPPARSLPNNRTPSVSTYWYDFTWPNFSDQGQCGHQHLFQYVWGWRYNGRVNGQDIWTVEYVSATATSTHWNTSTRRCEFQGTGNPDYTGLPMFASGNGVTTIPNSPFAVLYVKSQAQSHGGFTGCGAFGCFHPVLAIISY